MRSRRAGHEKSKNGCLTCKIRRVKCDETKPYCRKCTDTGRKCEGPATNDLQFRFIQDQPKSRSRRVASEISKFVQEYHVNEQQNGAHHNAQCAASFPKTKILFPEISLLRPQHSGVERRAFEHFIHRAAPCFAGAVEDQFWNVVVPCLAQSDPFVWDTVVSISWMFEHVPYDMLVTTFESKHTPYATSIHHRQALKWYNRGLSNLRERIDRNEMDGPFALFSCILCLCVEFQQRNVGNAMHLLQSGYKIFGQSLFTKHRVTSTKSLALDQVVTPFFSRHAILIATMVILPLSDWIGNSGVNNLLESPSLPSAYALTDTRSHLYHIMYQAYEIIRVAVLMWNDEEVIQILLTRRRIALDELKRWRASFVENWPSTTQQRADGDDSAWLYSHLLMCWDVCYIWLSSCTIISQTAFDEHMDHFADIILHAERLLSLDTWSDKVEQQKPSTFETGIIPALYFTGVKCRDPVLRRKALQLSRRAPDHQSLWANVLMDRSIEQAISVEEGQPYAEVDMTDPCVLAELCARPLPPEERRIQHIAVLGRKSTETGHLLALQLGKIAVDADGHRRLIHENVWLEEWMSITSQHQDLECDKE